VQSQHKALGRRHLHGLFYSNIREIGVWEPERSNRFHVNDETRHLTAASEEHLPSLWRTAAVVEIRRHVDIPRKPVRTGELSRPLPRVIGHIDFGIRTVLALKYKRRIDLRRRVGSHELPPVCETPHHPELEAFEGLILSRRTVPRLSLVFQTGK